MLEQGYQEDDFVNHSPDAINSWQMTLTTLIALTEPANDAEECPILEGDE